MSLMRAIGLMSGTSMDGVDVAMIETDGEGFIVQGPSGFTAYDDAQRAALRAALTAAVGVTDRAARPGALAAAEAIVTEVHARAVENFLRTNAIDPTRVTVLGFHGQTVLHRPERQLTIQIGDGAALAQRTGLRVVYDMRAADVAAGGQGAPLVPAYHRALVLAAGLDLPVGVLNLGGVGNLTFIGADGAPISCDTGPANALIDDLMLERTGVAMDRDGVAAAQGVVNAAALAWLMNNPYFDQPPPKSLDRNAFSRAPVAGLSTEDAAATLTAFTAQSVASLWAHLPDAPKLVVASGGGARNPILMGELARRLPCRVASADSLGWSADAMEAQAFAYLAVRSLLGLPLTYPTTTGAPRPLTGGVVALAA